MPLNLKLHHRPILPCHLQINVVVVFGLHAFLSREGGGKTREKEKKKKKRGMILKEAMNSRRGGTTRGGGEKEARF